MDNLLNSYLKTLQTQGDQDEAYKWEAINNFQETWNADADDFKQMFKSAFEKVHNLLYHNSLSYILILADYFPEEVRAMFKDLFNEELPLEGRIVSFQEAAKTLLPHLKEAKGIEKKLKTYQDERTISVYLSFRYPEKYYLYKASFYKKLCEYLGVPTEKAGERFIHYLKLAEEIKEKYITNNDKAQQIHKSIYPEMSWNEDNLITQNFLYSIFDKTKEMTNILPKLEGEEEFLKIISSHRKQDVFDYFLFLDRIIDRLDIQKDDIRVVTNTSSRNLNLTLGQRFCWVLFPAGRKKGKFSLITADKIDDRSSPFKGEGNQPFFNDFDDFSMALKNQESAFNAMKKELSRSTKSSYSKYKNLAFRNAIFDKDYRKHLLETSIFGLTSPKIMNVSATKIPLNQILYGPPGTGKTYKLQTEYFDRFTIKESSLSRQQFLLNNIADKTWWQVLSMAVLDLGNTSVENIMNHELVKTKVALGDSKLPRNTIWGTLQTHTLIDCPNVGVKDRSNIQLFWKDENSHWKVIREKLDEQYPDAISILKNIKHYQQNSNTLIKNYEFVTFHQSFSYEDFIEGIKPTMEEEDSKLEYEISDGIFKRLALKAKADPDNDYAIFIDEINRGNVSAIFGELITLIEEDKRSSGKNPLSIKLPYSKNEFEVPSNLYILGTMNTADRSVEALDTALRRRFSFKEIMSKPYLLKDIQFDKFNLEEVLETINERIEFLLDRDHTIGHSYFMKLESYDLDGLEAAFKNKIIPLLQEYFYHDYEKIALILGAGFVEVKTNHEVKFPNISGIDRPENVTLCELIENIDDIEYAVLQLLDKDEQ